MFPISTVSVSGILLVTSLHLIFSLITDISISLFVDVQNTGFDVQNTFLLVAH